MSGKLPIWDGETTCSVSNTWILITLIYIFIHLLINYVGDICGWCRLLALIQAVFLRGGLTPPTKQSFCKTCFGFYWCPDCSWCIGSIWRPQHRRTMCLLFSWACSQLKRGNSGVYLWSLLQPWRFCSLKNHHLHNLHRAKEVPIKPSVHWQWMETADLNKNDLAQRFAPMMWHNSFSTNWGHLFFVFDRHGKNLF